MVFADLPQAPLQEFDLHVFGSERGLLATPEQCGTLPMKTEFVPWDNALATRHSTSYMHHRLGPGGRSLPDRPAAASHPSLKSGVANSTGGYARARSACS